MWDLGGPCEKQFVLQHGVLASMDGAFIDGMGHNPGKLGNRFCSGSPVEETAMGT